MSKSNKSASKMKSRPASAKVVVKKEPPARHNKESLCHLVDDRVELIRQIFQTLKPKTIKSIAPDFLQKCSADYMQECCLEELLGISNKRLLSIINAEKCPTDTEDSDSDVENIEEHISLEEISSDSEDDKKSKQKKKAPNKASSKGDTDAPKPMSMLELLELQARARAIRSQLALEPVTKIELDSDNESNPTPTTSTTNAVNVKQPLPQPPKPTAPTVAPEPRPIRLKRNFRQRQNNADYEPSDEETAPVETSSATTSVSAEAGKPALEPETTLPTIAEPVVDNTTPAASNDASTDAVPAADDLTSTSIETGSKENETETPKPAKSRSPSPDIVPIISSPPTYCISSDDSDNEDQQFLQKIQKAGNYINMPRVTTAINRPETEDEVFLRKLKQTAADAPPPSKPSIFVDTPTIEPTKATDETTEAVVELEESEAEEGEISDEDVEQSKPPEKETTITDEQVPNDVDEQPQANTSKTSQSSSSSSGSSSESDDSDVEVVPTAIKSELLELNYRTDDIVDIDDDEDIIDLGKDQVLDFDVDAKEDPPKDEDAETDNWGNRWLRCKKVTKVMATARLANKVRSKIKKNKRKEARVSEEAASKATAEAAVVVPPAAPVGSEAIEEGSVEQYALIRGADVAESPATTE